MVAVQAICMLCARMQGMQFRWIGMRSCRVRPNCTRSLLGESRAASNRRFDVSGTAGEGVKMQMTESPAGWFSGEQAESPSSATCSPTSVPKDRVERKGSGRLPKISFTSTAGPRPITSFTCLAGGTLRSKTRRLTASFVSARPAMSMSTFPWPCIPIRTWPPQVSTFVSMR